MARYTRILRCILAGLILFAAIAGASDSGERKRHHVDDIDGESREPSGHRRHATRSLKLSTSKSNEITDEPGKKVSHQLIGGHLRAARPTERGESEATWDDGFLLSSAGNGKERKNVKPDEDDDKKTLSQQVKEGKYGLIQDEIYPDKPKRPGIISYKGNPEVPKDNAANLGGLDEDEIWLAENHVLVLRGGKFPEHDPQREGTSETDKPWKPIDDYQAPKRQVKIPSRPKVPPPFPIQLTDGGPIQIIGPNGTTEIDKTALDYDNNPFYKKGQLPGQGPFFAIAPNGTLVSNGFVELGDPKSYPEEKVKFGPPSGIPGSIVQGLPPGAVFVPPPSNFTDYDEEDQSIYYPPPYSFQYQQENSTAVPPGPLVPGIILPPPPDFFAPLDEKKPTTKKHGKRPETVTTPSSRSRPTYLPPRKLTTKYRKTSTPETPTTVRSCKNAICNFRFSTRNYPKNISHLGVTTTPSPVESTTTTNSEYPTINPVIGNQVVEANAEEKNQWTDLVNEKVPVLAYYPTTTVPTVERPVEVTPASVKNIFNTNSHPSRTPSQASYYFYEEAKENAQETTENPSPVHYRSTTMPPYYKVELFSPQEEQRNEFYRVETVSPEENTKDYNVKVLNSLVKEPLYSATPKPSKYKVSSTRAQSQRVLAQQEPIYYEAISDHPSLAVESFPTTLKPQTYYKDAQPDDQFEYRQEKKPKPIYQYSFEAADYSKSKTRQPYRYQTQEEQRQQVVFNEYPNDQATRVLFSQKDGQIVQNHQREAIYKPQQTFANPTVITTTINPIVDVTTENPQHTYFTQQEEKLLDPITKTYFTMFGKKLNGKELSSTTPLYGKSSSITEKPSSAKSQDIVNTYTQNDYNHNEREEIYNLPSVDVRYGDSPKQKPISLEDDILVNFKNPPPTIDPDSEFITTVDWKRPPQKQQQQQQPLVNDYEIRQETPITNRPEDIGVLHYRRNGRLRPIHGYKNLQKPLPKPVSIHESRPRPPSLLNDLAVNYRMPLPRINPDAEFINPPSLLNDVAVNYRKPPPRINPDAEFIDPALVQGNQPNDGYFAYRLPGDGGHFYFLTPQVIAQKQEHPKIYLYPKEPHLRVHWRRRDPR